MSSCARLLLRDEHHQVREHCARIAPGAQQKPRRHGSPLNSRNGPIPHHRTRAAWHPRTRSGLWSWAHKESVQEGIPLRARVPNCAGRLNLTPNGSSSPPPSFTQDRVIANVEISSVSSSNCTKEKELSRKRTASGMFFLATNHEMATTSAGARPAYYSSRTRAGRNRPAPARRSPSPGRTAFSYDPKTSRTNSRTLPCTS